MNSLIGSFVNMRDCEAGALWERSCMRRDSNTGSLGAKQACAGLKNGLCVFRLRVHSSHVLRPLSVTRSHILNVSTCKVVCLRYDDPMNGPTGDPT